MTGTQGIVFSIVDADSEKGNAKAKPMWRLFCSDAPVAQVFRLFHHLLLLPSGTCHIDSQEWQDFIANLKTKRILFLFAQFCELFLTDSAPLEDIQGLLAMCHLVMDPHTSPTNSPPAQPSQQDEFFPFLGISLLSNLLSSQNVHGSKSYFFSQVLVKILLP